MRPFFGTRISIAKYLLVSRGSSRRRTQGPRYRPAAMQRITRREALGRGAGLAGLAAGGGVLAACGSPAETPDAPSVVIVGAGLAGLTCAHRLRQAGIASRVFQAQQRVGGRCWSTRTVVPGLVGEHGGELIDTGHRRIRALAGRTGTGTRGPPRRRAPGGRARRRRPRRPAPHRGRRRRGLPRDGRPARGRGRAHRQLPRRQRERPCARRSTNSPRATGCRPTSRAAATRCSPARSAPS